MATPADLIETALLDALKTVPLLDEQVRSWEVLPEVSPEEITAIFRACPAIAVVAGSAAFTDNVTGAQDESGLYTVFFFTRNLRSPGAALSADASGEAGAYDLLYAARNYLLGDAPLALPGVISCRPKRRVPLRYKRGEVLYALDVEVRYR